MSETGLLEMQVSEVLDAVLLVAGIVIFCITAAIATRCFKVTRK